MQIERDNHYSARTKSSYRNIYAKHLKSAIEFFISACAIAILFPLLLVVAILVKIKLGSPVIFKQKRCGKDGKIFVLYKFRSMTNDKDENGKLLSDMERLSKFGERLRATSLDELPELWNILRGDMSIIGPRPLLVSDMVFMTQDERMRHSVRPGLSGLAQINGRNCISWEDKLQYDLQYTENITFIEDWRIILVTILKLFKSESISYEGFVIAEDLGDYLLRTGRVEQSVYLLKQEESKKLLLSKMI